MDQNGAADKEDSVEQPVVNGSQMVELGNSKDTTKTDCSDPVHGRLTGVHTVLCSAAEIACTGRQDFCLGHYGGYMIPIHSKIGQGMRIHLGKLVNWHGKNKLILAPLENNIFNFYLNREVKSTDTDNVNDADHYLAKNCQQSGNGDGTAVRS